MPDATKLALVGFGLVGRRHAAAIAQSEAVRLVAVVEPSPTARAEAQSTGARVFETLEACLSEAEIDGVILATPNTLHVAQALSCIRQNLPVLVEKPIATTSEDAHHLVALAETMGVPLLVGHHRRHNPIIRMAKELIGAGEIGTVRAVQACCWLFKPDSYFEAAEWRGKQGAGPIAINLVHDIDLIRHLCGEVRSVRAAAAPSARGHEVEDVASALLEFDSGAIGTVSVSDHIVAPWSWELTARENPAYPPTSESCYLIGGSHGSLSLPDLRLWSYGSGPRDWWSPISATTMKSGSTDPLVNQINHFSAVIQGREQPVVSGAEGLKTLEVIEAIQHSAAHRKEVRLDQWARVKGAVAG